ncbi:MULTISPECIES: acylphosphatase [Desulfosediminicola]|uniref:acylphosphatase n=1 Tax=Desulfosediminicola TaxID=2886823 RepID=UPI0010ACB907|nr:acylphosphatase [Desulfosediminicola ganghwensis]
MKTLHVNVRGRVQGVFYRDYSKRQADLLNIRGWIRNMPDGSVEAVISGNDSDVDQMIEWFQMGSPLSHVTSVHAEEVFYTEDLNNFEIRYYR